MGYSDDRALEKINERNTEEYIPAIVFVVLVIVVGIIVNAFATLFYSYKEKRSVIQIFMLALSLNDVITNFSLISDVVGLFNYVQYTNAIPCKFNYFFTHWLIGDSLLFMVAISVDRYFRVCFPFSKQITIRVARCIILGLLVGSFLLAARLLVTADVVSKIITMENNATVKLYVCALSEEQEPAQVESVFHIVDILIHIAIICSVVFVYSSIVRKLVFTRKKIKSHKGPGNVTNKGMPERFQDLHTTSSGGYDGTSETNISDDQKVSQPIPKAPGNKTLVSKYIVTEQTTSLSTDENNTQEIEKVHKKLRKRRPTAPNLETRMTVMTAVITIVSIACFVPFYISAVMFKPDFSGNGLIFSVGILVFRRLYMLNSVINPFIIAVFNSAFRKFLRDSCPKCVSTSP